MNKNISLFKQLALIIYLLIITLLTTQATNLTISTPTVVPGGTNVDTLIVMPGGAAQLMGDITVNNIALINTGGVLVCNNYKVTGTASFTLSSQSAISYSQQLLDSAITTTGMLKSFSTSGIYILTGTDRQNLTGSFPATVGALVINNPDSVYKNGQIEIIDSLVIYQGTLNLNTNRLNSNNNLTIKNNSVSPHNFQLRMDEPGKIYTITGTQTLQIRGIDTQDNNNIIRLNNNMQIFAGPTRLEKGSYIDLNGYTFTMWSGFSHFSEFGNPNYFDFDDGGTVVFEFSGNNTKTVNFKLATGDIKSFAITTNSGTYNPGASISVSYKNEATGDSALVSDYISSYLDISVNNITAPNYKIDYYYNDGDITGNENLMTPQRYVGATWYESPNKAVLITSTNNIVYDSLTSSALIMARTGSVTNLPNLVINAGNSSELTPYLLPDGSNYDSVIIENRGVAELTADYTIKNLFIQTGGKLKCGTYTCSGVNFINEPSSYLCIGSTQGIDKSKGTTGNIRFYAANYNSAAYYWYNGSTTQSLGQNFSSSWSNVYNLIIDNPIQVNTVNDMTLTGSIELRKGKLNGSNLLSISGPNAKIINNAGFKSLTNLIIRSNNVNDNKKVEISGDSATYIKRFDIDQRLDITLLNNATLETSVDGYDRGYLYVGNNTLTLRATALTDSVFDMARVFLSDQSVIKQEIISSKLGKNLTYRIYTGTSTSIPAYVRCNGTVDTGYFEFSIIDKKYSLLPDTNNCISRYMQLSFNNITALSFNAQFTYATTGDITGNIGIMEAGLYNGSNWSETGMNLNTGTRKITVTASAEDTAIITAGELHPVGIPSIDSKKEINIYPSVTTGIVFIDGVSGTAIVLNALGQVVMKSAVRANKNYIDLKGLSNGLYFIKIADISGVQAQRIIKQ